MYGNRLSSPRSRFISFSLVLHFLVLVFLFICLRDHLKKAAHEKQALKLTPPTVKLQAPPRKKTIAPAVTPVTPPHAAIPLTGDTTQTPVTKPEKTPAILPDQPTAENKTTPPPAATAAAPEPAQPSQVAEHTPPAPTAIPTTTQKTTAPATVQAVQAPARKSVSVTPTIKKRKPHLRHAWHAHTPQAAPQEKPQLAHTITSVSEQLYKKMPTQTKSSQADSSAEKAVARFNGEFSQKVQLNYIDGVKYAICFSLNRMRITVAPRDMPPLLHITITLNRAGKITNLTIDEGGTHQYVEFCDLILQGVRSAGPFRPVPESIKGEALTIPLGITPGQETAGYVVPHQPIPITFFIQNPYQ